MCEADGNAKGHDTHRNSSDRAMLARIADLKAKSYDHAYVRAIEVREYPERIYVGPLQANLPAAISAAWLGDPAAPWSWVPTWIDVIAIANDEHPDVAIWSQRANQPPADLRR